MTQDEVEAVGMALCQNALGVKQCSCLEKGVFNCADTYPGYQAEAAIPALDAARGKAEPVAWSIDPVGYSWAKAAAIVQQVANEASNGGLAVSVVFDQSPEVLSEALRRAAILSALPIAHPPADRVAQLEQAIAKARQQLWEQREKADDTLRIALEQGEPFNG